MGRGVSSGGGQSSLGYLFGSDPAPANGVKAPSAAAIDQQTARRAGDDAAAHVAREVPSPVTQAHKELPAAGKAGDSGTSLDMGAARLGRNSNNYHRADGQNTGNFITYGGLGKDATVEAIVDVDVSDPVHLLSCARRPTESEVVSPVLLLSVHHFQGLPGSSAECAVTMWDRAKQFSWFLRRDFCNFTTGLRHFRCLPVGSHSLSSPLWISRVSRSTSSVLMTPDFATHVQGKQQ